MKKTEWIWMDGKLVPWAEANIHVSTHALHYGTGVFEGIRAYSTESGPAIFRLDAHVDRLLRSGGQYFQVPFTAEQLTAGCIETVKANNLQACYLRPIAFLGAGNLGVGRSDNPVHVAIMVFPWDTYLGDKALKEGVRICFSSWHRIQLSALPMHLKASGQYLNSYLAVTEAKRKGYDEALLFNEDGTLAEGSGENLFLVQDGKLITNGLESAILPGITRDSILTLARDLGIETTERALHKVDLGRSQEAFFTGTAAEVTPIREIGEFQFGPPGKLTQRLQEAFFRAVRRQFPGRESWLTPVV